METGIEQKPNYNVRGNTMIGNNLRILGLYLLIAVPVYCSQELGKSSP